MEEIAYIWSECVCMLRYPTFSYHSIEIQFVAIIICFLVQNWRKIPKSVYAKLVCSDLSYISVLSPFLCFIGYDAAAASLPLRPSWQQRQWYAVYIHFKRNLNHNRISFVHPSAFIGLTDLRELWVLIYFYTTCNVLYVQRKILLECFDCYSWAKTTTNATSDKSRRYLKSYPMNSNKWSTDQMMTWTGRLLGWNRIAYFPVAWLQIEEKYMHPTWIIIIIAEKTSETERHS